MILEYIRLYIRYVLIPNLEWKPNNVWNDQILVIQNNPGGCSDSAWSCLPQVAEWGDFTNPRVILGNPPEEPSHTYSVGYSFVLWPGGVV